MARIVGGSKGCHACRKRKKRCDERRPSCGQCLSRNASCPGYVREAKFILVSYHDGRRAASGSSSNTEAQSDRQETDKRPSDRVANRTCSSGLSSEDLSLQCSAVAYYYSFYFHNNVIQTGLDVFGKSSYIDWMWLTPELDIEEPSLRSALLALGTARMGRVSNDPRLTRLSAESYSQSLRHLRKTILNRALGLRDEALASMMFLAIYEILEGSSNRGLGWASHTHGAMSLVHSQGLEMEWSEARHRLFNGLRLSAIIHSIGTRKPTYLGTPEWTSIPWRKGRKEPKQYLFDLMAEIPALLEAMDSVNVTSDISQSLERLHEVCERYMYLAQRLYAWYETYMSDHPSKGHWEQPSRLPSVSPNERSPPTCIGFPDHDAGHIHLLYWTSHVLLFSNIGMVYESCVTNAPYGTHISLPPFPCDIQEMHGMALNIARSAEYFLEPKVISLGACIISFPASIAFGYFEYYNLPECDWFRQIFRYIKTFGIDMEGFLDAVASETSLQLVVC